MDKKIAIFGAIGVGALALMSFGKAPKPAITVPIQPQPDPVLPSDVVVDDVAITDPVNNEPDIVVADPIQYIEPDKDLNIISVKKNYARWSSTGYELSVNLQFTNNTDNEVSLKDVSKIAVSRADGSKFLGNAIVNFNNIVLQPLQTIILSEVILRGLENDVFIYNSFNFNQLIQFKAIFTGAIDPDIVIVAPDVLVNEQYIIKNKEVIAYPVLKNTSNLVNNNLEFDYNIIIENNTNDPFYLNTVKAIKILLLYGYDYVEVSINPFTFANIMIPANDQVMLQNIILKAPYNYLGKKMQFILREEDLKSQVKLQFLY